ncbi:Acetyltransferase (GNAT) family protein [compost metagenome]
MDVHPAWQRHGIGRRLMQAILNIGQQRGLTGATLTTDKMAAFNARFYATLGFEIVEGLARPPHLVSLIAEELATGFNPARRAAMCMTFSDAHNPPQMTSTTLNSSAISSISSEKSPSRAKKR